MVVRADQTPSPESDGTSPTLEDSLAEMLSSFSEAEFTELVQGMVDDEAPRVFAIVQEYGDRIDVRVAAWGMTFDNHAEIVGTDGRTRMSARSPDTALRIFSRQPNTTARLVWPTPDATIPPDEIDAA